VKGVETATPFSIENVILVKIRDLSIGTKMLANRAGEPPPVEMSGALVPIPRELEISAVPARIVSGAE
jgi:hypothetical protein